MTWPCACCGAPDSGLCSLRPSTTSSLRLVDDRPGTATGHEAATRPVEPGPTITATLADGPLERSSIEVEVVEGRPPKIIDVPVDHGRTCRYCLEGWVQSGSSAVYTFLYRV